MNTWAQFLASIVLLTSVGVPCVAQQGGGDLWKRLDKNGDKAISRNEAGARVWSRLSRLDGNGDGQVTSDEFLARTAPGGESQDNPTRGAEGPKPTFSDIRYSKDYSRSTLDIWLPKTPAKNPFPMVVYFHGGGLRMGNKSMIFFKDDFLNLTNQGIAIVSVGYPLLGDQDFKVGGPKREQAIAIMEHAGKAVSFLRKHAEKYQLDGERFVLAGNSAGCGIAQYNTYAKPLGARACFGIQQASKGIINYIDADSPPLVLYTESGPDDSTHNPSNAADTKEHCDKVGATCFLFGSKKSGLPQLPGDQKFVPHAISLIKESMK
ncbi:MAG: alpha/beta hydrolase fold domain-containing protein [Planctomycetota bacterium]